MKNLHTFEEFLNESYAYDIRRGLKHIKFILSDPLMYKTPFYISFKKGTNEKEVEALIKDEEKENKSVSKMKRTYGTNPYNHLTLQIENPNYGGLTWIFKAIDKLYGNSGESMGWHGELQESVNESSITPMQMEMKGKTLINKISIGAKFEGELDNKAETLTVIGYGDRANAFKIFEVETSNGTKTYLKVTVMYGCNYRVMDNPRGNWDAAKGFNLKTITI